MASQFHVLAVEDDENDSRLIELAARRIPLVKSLRVLASGEEAQLYLGGKEPYADRDRFPFPNLLLLDLKLRRMTGLDLLRWVRQDGAHRTLPVVVLSGRADASDLNRAYELGIDAYHVKPAGLPELANILSGVLVTLSARPSIGA